MVPPVTKKLQTFFGSFKKVTFSKGETIIRADENPLTDIYYIMSGYIRQYALSKDGEEKTITLFRSSSYVPTIYALNTTIDNHFFFEATTAVIAYKAPACKVVEFLRVNSDVLFDLTTRLARGLDMISIVLENVMSTCAQAKIAAVFMTFGRRFGKQINNVVKIEIPLTHKEIGSFAGVTRETVSREVQKLIDQEVLSKKDNLYTINDLNQFERLLSS